MVQTEGRKMKGKSSLLDTLLLPLKNGEISQLDMPKLRNELKTKRKQEECTERLQYALYCYCLKRGKDDIDNVNIIVQLASVCYESCVQDLKNPARLTGCLATIHKYLVVNDHQDLATQLATALKKAPSTARPDCSANLLLIHHSTIEAAVKVKGNDASVTNLITQSLVPIEFMLAPNPEYASKIARNIRHAANCLTYLTGEKTLTFLEEAKKQLSRLNGTEGYEIEEYLVKRICHRVSSVDTADKIARGVKLEVETYFRLLKNPANLQDVWCRLIDATLNGSDLEEGLSGFSEIIKASDSNELARSCAMALSLVTAELWSSVRGDDVSNPSHVFVLYDLMFLPIVNIRDALRESNAERAYSSLGRLCGTVAMLSRACTKHLPAADSEALQATPDGSPGLVPIMLHVLSVGRECVLNLTHLKASSSMIKYIWSQIAVRVVNSVEDVMTLCTKAGAEWQHVESLCEVLLTDNVPPLPIEASRIALLYDRWALALANQGKLDEAMSVRRVQAHQNPMDLHSAVSSWVVLQMQLPSRHKYKEWTFVDYMREKGYVHRKDESKLSLVQLKSHRAVVASPVLASAADGNDDTHESSQVGACMRAWDQLKRMKPTVQQLALGLMNVVMAIVGDVTPEVLAELIKDCEKIIKLVKNLKDDGNRYVYEGALELALFLCEGREIRHRHQVPDETRNIILSQLRLEAKEKAKYGEEVDNVACDMEPRPGSLAVDAELEKLTHLDAAFMALVTVIKPKNDESPDKAESDMKIGTEEMELAMDCLTTIGNHALLLGDVDMAANSWTFFYLLACLEDNKLAQVSVLSKLVLHCGLTEDLGMLEVGDGTAQALVAAAGGDIRKLSQPQLVAYVSFKLGLASACIISNSFKRALAILTECSENLTMVKHQADYFMLKARYLSLIGQLLLIAGPSQHVAIETSDVQHAAYLAFSHLKAALTFVSSVGCSVLSHEELLLTMLDVTLWCADVSMSLLLVTYVRTFVEDVYEIFQKLGLLARTAQILAVLVNVDLAVQEEDDFANKLMNYLTMIALPTPDPPQIPPQKIPDLATKYGRIGAEQFLLVERDLSPMRCGPPSARSRSPLMDMLRPDVKGTSHEEECECRFCAMPIMKILKFHARSMIAMSMVLHGSVIQAVNYQDAVLLESRVLPFPEWDSKLSAILGCKTKTRFYARMSERVWIDAVCHMIRCLLLMPDQAKNVAALLTQCDIRLLTLAPATRVLIQFPLLELHVCLWTMDSWAKPHPLKYMPMFCDDKPVAKTPHTAKKRGPEVMAPVKGGAVDVSEVYPMVTPLPLRGRRIFDNRCPPDYSDPNQEFKDVACCMLHSRKKTVGFQTAPPTTRGTKPKAVAKSETKPQIVKGTESAVKPLKKKPKEGLEAIKTPANRQPHVADVASVPLRRLSDSDCSPIQATPSPLRRSTHKLPLSQVKAARATTRAARPLIFEESELDLFAPFEQKLKIADGTEKTVKKKTEVKNNKGKKVEATAPVALRKPPR